jgi:DNA invertase Pin-like site-specific DNA recombinase
MKVVTNRCVRPQARLASVKTAQRSERSVNITRMPKVSAAARDRARSPKIHIYTRVSSEERARPYHTSLADQERIARDAIARFDVQQDIVVWQEPGHSGKSPIASRPIGGRMVADIQPGDTVVVTKVDRLSRHTASGITQVETWRSQGVKILMLDLPLPPTGDWSAALDFSFHMFCAAAQFEHGRICERMQAGRAAKIALGQYPYSAVSFGWMIERRGPSGRELYKVENPQEQAIRRRGNELFDQGLKRPEIAVILTREGHRNRAGNPITAKNLKAWFPDRKHTPRPSLRPPARKTRKTKAVSLRRPASPTAVTDANGARLKPRSKWQRATAAERVLPYIDLLISQGATSYQRLADQLNVNQVPALRGVRWHPSTVSNLMLAARRRWGQSTEGPPPEDLANVIEFARFSRPDRREREAVRVKYRLDEALPPKRRGRVQKLIPDILALHDRPVANERIARLLGIHVNSVQAVLKKFADPQRQAERSPNAALAAATLPLSANSKTVVQVEKIIAARLAGATGLAIAAELGIAQRVVYEAIRRAKRINMDLALQRPAVTEAQRTEIIVRRSAGGEGAKPASIAAVVGLGEHTVRRVINQAATENPALAFRQPPISAKLAAEMAQAAAQGASFSTLAEEYGYSLTSIGMAVRKARALAIGETR